VIGIEAIQIGNSNKRADTDQSTLADNLRKATEKIRQFGAVVLWRMPFPEHTLRVRHLSHVEIGQVMIG
jgi:hypothetical protein